MRGLSISELREAFPSFGVIMETEGEMVLRRHGRAVAKIAPVEPPRTAPSHADLRAGMGRMGSPSEELVRADRDRG